MSRDALRDLLCVVLAILFLLYCGTSRAGEVDQRWKDRNHNADPTGVRYELFEANDVAGVWISVPSYRLPSPAGLPANERISRVLIPWPAATTPLRVMVTDEAGAVSPWSAVYVATASGACSSDMNSDGAVSLADVGIAWARMRSGAIGLAQVAAVLRLATFGGTCG